ncbi:MAG: hypothetical protein QW837_09405, partial [Conexivisphaerales archaeon]
LASLAITLRGLRLPVYRECGWPSLKDEYLCTGHEPKVAGAGFTEKVNAPNDGYKKLNLSETVKFKLIFLIRQLI